MATLDELLALLPDNQTGEISAADLRQVVTGLWDYTAEIQAALNQVVVTGLPAAQAAIADVDARLPLVGQVASDGTWVGGPDGWSSSYDAASGLYTVTHNLGTDAYAVVVTPMVKAEGGYAPAVEATTPTSFTYGVWSSTAGGLHGMYTNFVVGVLDAST